MSFLRLQVSVPRDTLVPSDAAVMTWHFITDEVGTDKVEEAADVITKMTVFYDAVDNQFSSACGTSWTYTVYDLEDAEPRVPLIETTVAHVPGVTFLPAEVAICLSMQRLPVSGASQRRRRGRVFLGPLSQLALELASGDVRISSVARTAITTAAADLTPSFIGATSGSTIRVCVFSRADLLDTGLLSGAFHPVEQWWVDDAYDTQRRRGVDPVTRTTVTDA